ncbi:MAG: aminotransferase class I/II-fold pyridoxal phosphate-dependent enzyme, partial [Gammaproteobacteria bacterium]|nr:aminotransferase class I/II-fold pyridoxal phosphate-dependent enzyme [Gammaproteobacteria bacterium]
AGDAPQFIYTRWGNPTVRMLEQKLAALEGGEACATFASGMAATTGLMLSRLKTGDHLVISEVNYPGTAELARSTLPGLGIEVTPVNTAEPERVRDAMRPTTRLVWVETPANPVLRLTDVSAVAQIAREAGAELAVDSTFATPIATRPLELGADFVVHSLTKYIGGHGDAIGGAAIGSADRIGSLAGDALVHHGGILSPFNAWLIARGAATLPLRMAAHEAAAKDVARFLEAHPKVLRTLYPGLASHPQHELARRQMDSFSGMISFRIAGGAEAARELVGKLKLIHHAVSLGHHRSLIYWIDTEELALGTYRLAGEALARYRDEAGEGVLRLSVGLEDAADICADLDQAL